MAIMFLSSRMMYRQLCICSIFASFLVVALQPCQAFLILRTIPVTKHNYTPSPYSHNQERVIKTHLGAELGNNEEGNENKAVVETLDTQESSPQATPPRAAPPVARGPPLTSQQIMQGLGTTPRRIALSMLSGTGIALAGNLFGVTSNLLQLVDAETVEATGLDTYFPRGNYKRVKTKDYTFLVPKQWVADTAIELLKTQQRATSLDFTMSKTAGNSNSQKGYPFLPDAAFGPPGRFFAEAGDTNVSVIQTAIPPNFSLASIMKSPQEGSMFLLQNYLAPNKSSTLMDATRNGQGTVYTLEYQVQRGSVQRQAISVLAQARSALYTLTVVSPQSYWNSNESELRLIADSFHLYDV